MSNNWHHRIDDNTWYSNDNPTLLPSGCWGFLFIVALIVGTIVAVVGAIGWLIGATWFHVLQPAFNFLGFKVLKPALLFVEPYWVWLTTQPSGWAAAGAVVVLLTAIAVIRHRRAFGSDENREFIKFTRRVECPVCKRESFLPCVDLPPGVVHRGRVFAAVRRTEADGKTNATAQAIVDRVEREKCEKIERAEQERRQREECVEWERLAKIDMRERVERERVEPIIRLEKKLNALASEYKGREFTVHYTDEVKCAVCAENSGNPCRPLFEGDEIAPTHPGRFVAWNTRTGEVMIESVYDRVKRDAIFS